MPSDGSAGEFAFVAGLYYDATAGILAWNFAGSTHAPAGSFVESINDEHSGTPSVLRLEFDAAQGDVLWYKPPHSVYGILPFSDDFPFNPNIGELTCDWDYFAYEDECYIRGDINSDGILNILDVVGVVNFVMGISNPDGLQAAVADVNEDGNIDILDIVSIINIILNN